MNIGINTAPLVGGHSNRGIGRYTKGLLDALHKSGSKHTFSTFETKAPDNVDLVHYPFFDFYFLTLPMVKRKPTIVTIHDTIPLVFPDKFPAGIKGKLKWLIQKQSLSGVKRIITDSNNSKKDIHTYTGAPISKIDVVYLAPDKIFTQTSVKESHVRKDYNIQSDYILYVGDINWNKNISNLLIAFKHLTDNSKKPLELVLVGKSFKDENLPEARALEDQIRALSIDSLVKRIGSVSDEDMRALYCESQALVHPSLYEGFGLPLLEAMAAGVPVVCGNNSSLSEIAGPSVFVDVLDPSSIVKGVQSVLSFTPKVRADAIQKGKEWANQFSWERTAKETIAVYEHAL